MRRKILCVALCLAAGVTGVPAQGVRALPADSKVISGSFPNGMNWYVVSNPAEKGFADFALVYRHSADAGDYVDISRRILSEPGRVHGRSLQKFLSSNGIAPSSEGYVSCTGDAVTFGFDDVMLSRKPSLADSLMLAVFGIADELSSSAVTVKDSLHFPLENMAVIVSGDVNGKELVSKMGIFSLMTPKNSVLRDSSAVVPGEGEPAYGAKVRVDTVGNVCRLTAAFSFPRIPKELMPTPQFAVVDKMSETFCSIAENRLRMSLDNVGIPFAELSSSHVSSADVPGNESVSLSLCTSVENAGAALGCMGSVLGEIDRGNISIDEIRLSSMMYSERCLGVAGSSAVRNSEYVSLCRSSFLYGAPLSTDSQICSFCQSRVLPDTLQLRLMKNFSEALLSVDGECAEFAGGWNKGETSAAFELPMSDTLLLHKASLKKSKVKTAQEKSSGGEVWTWQNGLKTYYRRVPGAKKIYWGLSVDKGYASSGELIPGEAAFLPDLLELSSISGIPNSELRQIMAASGITAEAEVGLFSTSIRGTALPSSLKLVFQGLVGMFRERTADTLAVNAYAASVPVRRELAASGRNARLAGIDSLMCADNPYSGIRIYDNFTDGTVQKAAKLFDEIFSDIGNGFLVITGDIDADVVKNALAWYAGEFPVTASAARRPRVRFQPVSGWSTTFRTGEDESIDVLLSTALPVNVANLCASRLASCLLEDLLHDELVGTGFHVAVHQSFLMYPQERFSVMVSLDRAPEDGFAFGSLEDTEILSVLARLRDAITAAPDAVWSDAVLNAYKARLKNEHDASVQSPEYWRDALLVRYADGRDFSTKMNEVMGSVTAAQVKDLLKKLVGSSRVEYVVMK